jgi:hypothetical protein
MKPIDKNAALGMSHARHSDEPEKSPPVAFGPSVRHIRVVQSRRRAKGVRISEIPSERVATLLQEIVRKTTLELNGKRVLKLGGEKAAFALLDREIAMLCSLKIDRLMLYHGYRTIRVELRDMLGQHERVEDRVPPSWR